MTAVQWLILVIVLAIAGYIGIPILLETIRSRDFKAQVRGKKAMRSAEKEGDEIVRDSRKRSMEAEANEYDLWMKSKQNFFGPKGRRRASALYFPPTPSQSCSCGA